MCARYRLTNSPAQIARHLGILEADVTAATANPRFNIAISQAVPIVREAAGRRTISAAEWGFRAPWDSTKRIFNAMAETAAEKPTFRAAFRERRCLMPADGFYEWPNKRATLIHCNDDRLFCFAGLCKGSEVTMLTCAPNDFMRPIHHRMPVILRADDYARWLNPHAAVADLMEIIASRPWTDMIATPAGTLHADSI